MRRFGINHLPFKINSAFENFQQRMLKIVKGIPGVLYKTNVLIFGDSKSEHDEKLTQTLEGLFLGGPNHGSQTAYSLWDDFLWPMNILCTRCV